MIGITNLSAESCSAFAARPWFWSEASIAAYRGPVSTTARLTATFAVPAPLFLQDLLYPFRCVLCAATAKPDEAQAPGLVLLTDEIAAESAPDQLCGRDIAPFALHLQELRQVVRQHQCGALHICIIEYPPRIRVSRPVQPEAHRARLTWRRQLQQSCLTAEGQIWHCLSVVPSV